VDLPAICAGPRDYGAKPAVSRVRAAISSAATRLHDRAPLSARPTFREPAPQDQPPAPRGIAAVDENRAVRSLPKFAAGTWTKRCARARKHERLRRSTSPKKLHELRIALRKAVTRGVFCVRARASAAKLAKAPSGERVLGCIHDVDMEWHT